MRILSRYLMKTVLQSSIIVLLAVVGIEIFLLLMGELSDIGHGHYHFWQALVYVVMSIPDDLYQMFPMVMLMGSLMGLGNLATHSELTVMRAATVSKMQITTAVVKAALILFFCVFLIGEVAGPYSQHFAQAYKQKAMHGAVKQTRGTWLRSGNRFIHVGDITRDGKLNQITQFAFNNQDELTQATVADHAVKRNQQWFLQSVKTTQLSAQGANVVNQAEKPWPVKMDASMLGLDEATTDEMSLYQLWRYIHYRAHNGLNTSHYWFSLWQRVLQPLATIVMICLAVPVVFGSLRSVSVGVRIVAGSMVAFAFYLLNAFFGPFSMLYQIPPLLAAAFPSLLVLGAGGYFYIKTH